MQISRSAYYSWLTTVCNPKPEDMVLKAKVKMIFDKSRSTYGSRRVVKALNNEGYKVGRFKVRGLMEKLKLKVRYPKRFKITTDSNHQLEVAPNTLNRQFKPTSPNTV